MPTIKLKPTQKKNPNPEAFFLLSGEGRQTHPSLLVLLLPASHRRATLSQHWAHQLVLTKNTGARALCNYEALYYLNQICCPMSSRGSARGAHENILHPQKKNLQVLEQRVPPPLVLRCPFLRATAGFDSLCVWCCGYHTHGKRVTVSKSSGGVMGGDSSPAARARTSLRSDIASGHGDGQKKSRHLPCPETSGHLHQTSGGVRSCQMHLGFFLVCFICTFGLN